MSELSPLDGQASPSSTGLLAGNAGQDQAHNNVKFTPRQFFYLVRGLLHFSHTNFLFLQLRLKPIKTLTQVRTLLEVSLMKTLLNMTSPCLVIV